MTKTIKSRVESLESDAGNQGDHEWTATIGWEGEDCHYYKDGIEISQAQYFREAPTQPIEVVWGEPIPPQAEGEDGRD